VAVAAVAAAEAAAAAAVNLPVLYGASHD